MLNQKGDEQMKRNSRILLVVAIVAIATLGLAGLVNAAATTSVNLGSADAFAILSGAGVTDAGGASVIAAGDVGSTPISGAAIGLLSSQLTSGTIYSVDAFGPGGSVENAGLLTTAWNDLTAAYNDAAARPADIDYGVTDNQLGGKTLYPGVYTFGHAATANLIGTLTLDANGDPNPVWIFQATSDLITASDSEVLLINGATPCDVFWQVSSSATLGTNTAFQGIIMADQSIALQTGATLIGAAQARIGSVTLDTNTITKNACPLFVAPTPTPAPGMPYTGLDGTPKVLPWNIVGIIGAFAALFLAGGIIAFRPRKAREETK
jgi:hypothetical protein